MPSGGPGRGGGRKPKISELALIERLTPMEDTALAALEAGLETGEFAFVKLYMEYRFGKPKDNLTISGGENPLELIISSKKAKELSDKLDGSY